MNQAWPVAALALLCAACTTPGASPDEGVGPAARGAAFARANCASCHAVEPGERLSPIPQATPFQIVVETPGLTQRALTVWLNTSHPTMPNLVVEPEHVDDLWAYLQTLQDGAEPQAAVRHPNAG